MFILLLKADQLGLFDKLVPVKAAVRQDGTVVAPHMAHRKVRAPVPPKPQRHAAQDLFSSAAPAPRPHQSLDLFALPADAASRPLPTPSAPAKPKPMVPTKRPAARPSNAPEAAPAPAEPARAAPAGGIDYNRPFSDVEVPAFGVGAGVSKGERRKLNARAAAMVGQTGADIFDVGPAEPADRAVLRQYSGNGGCGDSLNEFYTPAPVAAAMWAVLHRLGLKQGAEVLEPSCGAGVFLETAPKGVRVVGVEMDATSSKIAQTLYPGHEVAHSALEGFAVTDTRQFDAVIGNAPFGESRGSLARQDKSDLHRPEHYFMDTALDKAKAGGVVAMIVPTNILNGKNSRKLRQRLLCKGQFLGAGRMPNSAFEASHTDVTTDVLFFRKRPQDVAAALGAVPQTMLKSLGVWDEDYLSGAYYDAHPDNVFGTPGKAMRSFGEIDTVDGSMRGVPEQIAGLALAEPKSDPTVEGILQTAPDEDRERIRSAAARKPYDTAKRGDMKVIDGASYILEGDPLRWWRVDEFAADKAVSDAADLGALINRAVAGENIPDLEDRVNAYVTEHGLPTNNPTLGVAAHKDRDIYALIGAVDKTGRVSDVVTGKRAEQESTLDAAATSLSLEDGDGQFTPEQLAARWAGGTADEALDQLHASPDYALDPRTGLWTTLDVYASGDLWPKLDGLKAALGGAKPEDRAKYNRQISTLEGLIDAKALEDVEVELSSGFVPLSAVAAFFNQRGGRKIAVSYSDGLYRVREAATGYSAHGDGDLLERYLNRSGVKRNDKEDEWPTIDAWNMEFKTWLCGSPYRDEVETEYNRKYRGFRQRAYSTEPFDIPGLANRDKIKPHVYSGVRQALAQHKGILADDVGLGKTVQGLILARMLKVNGQARRPIVVVPKSVLANWAAEVEQWFPGSNYLTIGETFTRDSYGNLRGKADSPAERARKLHDLRQNDYDFILISQPAWNDVDLDPIVKKEQLDKDFWVQRGDSLGNAGDKRLNKIRDAWEQAKGNLDFKKRTDAVYFNDLGVDAIIGDEFHAYKNLYAARNQRGEVPKFLGGSGQSMRAQDTNLKCRWLQDQTGGVNVYGLTATPTKNSPLEVYSMLSHIAPEEFEARGIKNSEDFIGRYCEFRQEPILNTRGEIEDAMVTSGFKNLEELREVMRKFINRRTAEGVGLELPARDDRQHLVDMSPEQEDKYALLREQAREAAGSKDASGEMHIFSIMSRMSKAAIDLELMDPTTYAGAHSPKLATVVDNVVEGAKDGGQVVFAENVAVHGKLFRLLEAKGISPGEIGIFNADEAESSTKRQKLSDDFNSGKLKVVIGNATMEEGVNLQKQTTDMHHVDLPWNVAAMQQRNGRGLRQGNRNASIRIHTYLSKGSFDGYRYQTIASKKSWQDLLWHGGDRVENLAKDGPVSREDMQVMLAANPEEARKAMAASKAIAQAKYDAQQNTALSEAFDRYSALRRSYAKLAEKARDTDSGRRLKVKLDRARTSLEANPRLTDKALLDHDRPAMIQPQSGVAIHEGVAFELPSESQAQSPAAGSGKFVVVGTAPGVEGPVVRVRRYGQLTERTFSRDARQRYGGVTSENVLSFPLGDLGDAKPFAYDQAAETEEFNARAVESLKDIKGVQDLHGLPSAVLEKHYDAIQAKAKAGAKDYSFNLSGNYGGMVGLIGADGRPHAVDSYSARAQVSNMDIMIPTDAHRTAARDAYMAAERGKQVARVFKPESGRRTYGRGSYETKAQYPGGDSSNVWHGVADSAFGKGTADAWKEEAERERHETARRAKSFGEALGHVAVGAAQAYGVRFPKRGLAIAFAKAKREGLLEKTWGEARRPSTPAEAFEIGGYHNKHAVPDREPVGSALAQLAAEHGHPDLAAAMVLQSPGSPDQHAKALLKLDARGRGPALAYLIAKHPSLASQALGELAGSYTPAGMSVSTGGAGGGELTPDRYVGWRHKTLGWLAGLEGADVEGGEGGRRAA